MNKIISWVIFNNWLYAKPSANTRLTWEMFDCWGGLLAGIFLSEYTRYKRILAFWDRIFKSRKLVGDPRNVDWDGFRPLRLSREEDWSDWLAYLIETSEKGLLASVLLSAGQKAKRGSRRPEKVLREDVCGQSRPDILVQWGDGTGAHIEVKVGDWNFAKTYDTCLAVKAKHRSTNWTNHILLLPEQVDEWERVRQELQSKYTQVAVAAIEWTDVAVALRKAILNSKEPLTWMAWSYAFLGAVEQKLLNIPNFKKLSRGQYTANLPALRHGEEILMKGKDNDRR